MNREIKFRGKSETGRWVYGSYFNGLQWAGFIIEDAGFEHRVKVVPATVGQFTGLTDKNGTEIFEGDIVKAKFPYATTCVVKWDNDRCGFYFQPIDGIGKAAYDKGYKLNSYKPEVVGNFIENPYMLNK